jgi:hypothetical protein
MPFLLFLTFYFAVAQNQQAFSRFVLFNAMHAITLDVLFIFPDLLAVLRALQCGCVRNLPEHGDVCLVNGKDACLLGKTPWLPIVTDAAKRQVM